MRDATARGEAGNHVHSVFADRATAATAEKNPGRPHDASLLKCTLTRRRINSHEEGSVLCPCGVGSSSEVV